MDKIAIIGTACLFPGADTPEAYWENLVANKDSRISADKEHMGRDPKDISHPRKILKISIIAPPVVILRIFSLMHRTIH